MKFHCLLAFCLLHLALLGFAQHVEPGSCSQKCQNLSDQGNATAEENTVSESQTHCSCTPSCKLYGDCCYDSPYRFAEPSTAVQMVCISLASKGRFKGIARCSSNWNGSLVFCREGIGHLPPVTSQATGITYANTHCAVCNNDAEQLVTWKVDQRCCSEHENLKDQSQRSFTYRSNGYLYSSIPQNTDGIPKRCSCKYFAHNRDNSFADSLELRSWFSNQEISACSSTWKDEFIKNMCSAFLEPVYIADIVFRNVYCARCNYARMDMLYCKPVIINKMFSDGADQAALYNYCVQNDFRECVYYLSFWGRGRAYAFSGLMSMNQRDCVRRSGRRCCDGERYDSISRTCRQLQ